MNLKPVVATLMCLLLLLLAGLAQALLKTAVNALIMAAIVFAMLKFVENLPDIAKLGVAVPTAIGLYWVGAKLLKIEMLSVFTGKRA